MLEYEVKPDDAGGRLDVVVAGLYPQFSRSSMEGMFDKGLITVNRQPEKAGYKVRRGDEIVIDETYLRQEPEPIELPVIYEDEDVLVINKPAGMLTHSKGALNLEPSVASFIKYKITDPNLTGNRAGIVHRLDRGTTGVMIAAKNEPALKWLQKQFSQRKVKKEYTAIVEGELEPSEAIIEAPIGRNPKRPQTFKVMSDGKPAVTHYKTTGQFKKDGINYTKVTLRPQTGRTHQLRVHMSYIGHPIAGDHVYGQGGQPIFLHAENLEVTLPNRQRKNFQIPPPPRFKEFENG